MSDWGFWEWVAYAALFTAALIVAAETGFKTEPEVMAHLPDFFRSAVWGFAPACLVVVATFILLLRGLVFPPRNPPVVTRIVADEKPNSAWRLCDKFRLRTAACLLADIPPNDPDDEPPKEAQAMFSALDQAWMTGQLDKVPHRNPHVRITTRVSLEDFAKKRGLHPQFLVPF